MSETLNSLTGHLLGRIRLILEFLGRNESEGPDPEARFGDLLDSMGLVELVAILAEDFGVSAETIEKSVGGHFGTVAELAASLNGAGLSLREKAGQKSVAAPAIILAGAVPAIAPGRGWLAATAACLPEQIQPAGEIDAALNRPAGWLERHAGIVQRRIWADQDPLETAAAVGMECLQQAGLDAHQVGALLVTSEAPPLLIGLAASLHHRLGLPAAAVALDVGGACTGFLAALWTAQALLTRMEAVLIVAVEAPSRYLLLQPGPAGEGAALFGDGAAVCLLCARPTGPSSIPIAEIVLGTDGSKARMIQVERVGSGLIEVHLEGERLAGQAIGAMEQAVRSLVQSHGLALADVGAVVAHGGNGRMPGLLARRLGLPLERVWSETPQTGNLGSASLPVAWAAHQPKVAGPVVWTSVGAGLTWGAMLMGIENPRPRPCVSEVHG